MGDNRPYMSEREASAAARAVIPLEPGWSILSQAQRADLLERALEAAGVGTSEFERGTAWWLGNWSDGLVAVIARWVTAERPGTATEWALAYTHRPGVPGQPARRVVQPYPGEREAQAAVTELLRLAPEDEPALISRTIGPWIPAEESPDD
jgi:hypothetical protein